MYEAAWFFGGAFTFVILGRLLGYAQMISFVNIIMVQCIKLLGMMSENMALASTLKYQSLRDSNMPEEEIEKIKKVDAQAIHNWKVTTILAFLMSFPKKYSAMLKFYDWDGAMKVLDDIYKEEKKYHLDHEQ